MTKSSVNERGLPIAATYSKAWDQLAEIREHAFRVVDESVGEEALEAHGKKQAPLLLQGLDIQPTDIVLEIGCGVARLGREVAPHAGEWWGLDVSREMLSIAEERCAHLENVRLLLGDGDNLAEIPDNSVDKAYCHAVLIHMDKEDAYRYMREAHRVIKPGGLFYFDVWNICDSVGWLRWQVERKLYRSKADRPVNRNQFWTRAEVEVMLRMSGLDIVHLAETFSIQPVVTKIEDGPGYDDRLREVRGRHAEGASVLKYGPDDYEYFGAELRNGLLQHGIEPEEFSE